MLRCPVTGSEFLISNSITRSLLAAVRCSLTGLGGTFSQHEWNSIFSEVQQKLMAECHWHTIKPYVPCKCYRALGRSPAGGREVLSAYPWKYSTPLQWLLSYLTKLHSCCCNSSQTKPQKLPRPPINVVISHHCLSSLFRVGMRPGGECHPRRVVGHSCLRISSHVRFFNSFCALFWRCENRSYVNILVKPKLNSSFLCFYFVCCRGDAHSDSSWQLMSNESEGSLVSIASSDRLYKTTCPLKSVGIRQSLVEYLADSPVAV